MRKNFHVRLHLGLMSMSVGLPVRYGGVGISTHIQQGFCELGGRSEENNEEENRLIGHYFAVLGLPKRPILIRKKFGSHIGIGTGTQMRLCLLDLISESHNLHLSVEEMIALSGRGGASGIGCRAYYEKGSIIDLGRRVDLEDKEFKPSGSQKGVYEHVYLPTQCFKCDIIVAIPKFGIPLGPYGETEAKKFMKISNISVEDSYKSSYMSIHGVYLSSVIGRYDLYEQYSIEIQSMRWKVNVKKQLDADVIMEIDKMERCIGKKVLLSGWGPTVYAICWEGIDSVMIEKVNKYNSDMHSKYELIIEQYEENTDVNF